MRLKEIKEDMIIHCKTQEEADMLCEALGAEDKWKAYWKYAEDETCYHIHSNDICCYGTISSFTRKITEFSDLIIPDPELSAEEALLAYDQMCKENYCCNDCPIYGILGHECAKRMDGHITEIVDAIKKWKAEHEKKEPEIEWVYREFGAENYGEKFFQTEEEAIKRCEDLAKSQKTKQYARYERVCRVKEAE